MTWKTLLSEDSLGLRVLGLGLLNAVGERYSLALVESWSTVTAAVISTELTSKTLAFLANFVVVGHRSQIILPDFVATAGQVQGVVALNDGRGEHLISEDFVFLQQHGFTIL